MSEYACDLEMAQNSKLSIALVSARNIDHVSKIPSKLTFFSSKILRRLKIRREIEFEAK